MNSYFAIIACCLTILPSTYELKAQDDTTPYEKASVLIQKGDLDQADNILSQNINYTSPSYFMAIGELSLKRGRNDLALDNFTSALQLYQKADKPDNKDIAFCYSNIGLVYWFTGNNSLSLEYHLKALDIRQALFGDSSPEVAASYNDIGLVYSKKDPDKSLEYYEKALKIYKGVLGNKNEKTANALINIGLANNRIGFYGDATNYLQEALKIQKAIHQKPHPREAFIYSSLGNVEENLQRLEAAEGYQQKALDIYITLYGKKHPEVAETYNFLGLIAKKENDYTKAIGMFQRAITANTPGFDETDSYADMVIDSYYNADVLLLSMLFKAQSLEALHYQKTLKFRDLTTALRTLQQCDTLIEKIRHLRISKNDKIELGNISSEVYEDATRLSYEIAQVAFDKSKYRELAFYFAEKDKSSVLLGAITDAKAKSFANIPNELLEEEKELNARITFLKQKLAGKPSPEEETKYRNELFEANKTYRSFVKKLEKGYPDYFNLKYNTQQPNLQQLQGMLDGQTAMVSYFKLEKAKRLYIFRLTKTKYDILSVPLSDDLERWITGFRNAIYFDVKNTFIATSESLYAQLFPKPLPKKIKNIIIIPTGRLGVIPFEALLMKKTKEAQNADYSILPYLVKDYGVSYAYSASLAYQNQQPSHVKSSRKISLLAPIDFMGPGADNLGSLPATEEEIRNIEQIVGKSGFQYKTLLKGDASESFIKSDEVKGFDFIHFATHGKVNEDQPSLSQIYLSKKPGSSEDGRLFSGEIYNLQLNANLVALSACQTGLGKISKGEGIIGLSRALLFAGAQNLVVSLWSVADKSTAKLMVDFYSSFATSKQTGYTTPLHQAKLNMIRGKQYAKPFYWAPFVLIGK